MPSNGLGVPDSLTTSTASSASSVTASRGGVGAASGEDLAHFVQAFKEMAENLDEEGAANLLMWSPMFMPTVEGLMRHGDMRRPKPKLKGAQPREVKHPLPHPRAVEAAAERASHMEKMRRMYIQGQEENRQQQQPQQPPSQQQQQQQHMQMQMQMQMMQQMEIQQMQQMPTAPLAPPQYAPPQQQFQPPPPQPPVPLDDEWEEEVDDLLEWTNGLADMDVMVPTSPR